MAKPTAKNKKTKVAGAIRDLVGGSPAAHGLDAYIAIVGRNKATDGTHSLMIGHPDAPVANALKVPLVLMVPGKHGLLQELLMANGFVAVVNRFASKEISSWLRGHSEFCQAHVIDREGVQELEINGEAKVVYVKAGNYYWLAKVPQAVSVLLVGPAANHALTKRSSDWFEAKLVPILIGNPRLLVTLCMALAALFCRSFGVASLGLALIGKSSSGKSISQITVSWLVLGRNGLATLNATPIGLHDHMARQPDQPVFLEDAHGAAAAAALIGAIMDAGNRATRLISERARSPSASGPVSCALFVSAERGILDTARAGKQQVNSGVFARIVEVYAIGSYGMFDDLCGHADGAELANYLKGEAPKCAGLVGDPLVSAVAQNWEKSQRLWTKHGDTIRGQIMRAAAVDDVDPISGRLLDGLTFAAFIGGLLSQYEVAAIPKLAVSRAFGLVFKEHLSRLAASSSPVAQSVIESVRHFIQVSRSRFLPFAQSGDPGQPSGLAGYVKCKPGEDRQYLFFPGVFHQKFVEEFGMEAFQHLSEAGYLVTQKSRGTKITVRLKGGDGNDRQAFVSIKESILYSDDAE